MHANTGINKVFFIGHVEDTPSKQVQPNGTEALFFNLKTEEDAPKSPKQKFTESHFIILPLSKMYTTENFISKGTFLYIEGRIQSPDLPYNEVNTRTRTEVVVSKYEILA